MRRIAIAAFPIAVSSALQVSGIAGPTAEAAAWGARRAHDADTMALYQERFAERVIAVVLRLRKAGRLGVSEAQGLVAPPDPAAIERLGRRLIELGYPSSATHG